MLRQPFPKFPKADLSPELKSILPPSNACSQTLIVSEGRVVTEGDSVTLSFSDGEKRRYSITFSRGEPDLLTLRRHDPGIPYAFVMVLEERVRHRTLKPLRDGDKLETVAEADRVDNHLMLTGKIFLRYSFEINGLRTENTEFGIEVTPTDTAE